MPAIPVDSDDNRNSIARIGEFQNGREGMGKYLMTRICRALNVPPHAFYGGTVIEKAGAEDDQTQRVLMLMRESIHRIRERFFKCRRAGR